MKDVILIFPKQGTVDFQDVAPPYPLLFLSDILKKKYNVKIFDLRFDKIEEVIQSLNDNVVCVGVSTMTGPQLKYARKASQIIKKLKPSIPIVWGGVHPSLLPEITLKEDFIDFIVKGEGEYTFLELVEALDKNKDLKKIKGIASKNFNNPERELTKDINKISIPWELVNIENYIFKRDGRKAIIFLTSRGCPHRCGFCYNQVFNKRKWRGWNIKRCKEEINKLLDFGITSIVFYDDNFAVDKKRLSELCDFFKEKGIHWVMEFRVDYLDNQILKKIKQSNCDRIFVGAESGSQKILNLINKDIKVDDIIEFSKDIKETNINIIYSWMIGLPGETKKDLAKTLNLIDKLRKILPNSLHFVKIYTPYPGTDLYNLIVKNGLFIEPSSNKEWADFRREQCNLPYIKNKWSLKCICYTSYFAFYVGKRANVKFLYKIPLLFLKPLSKLRWKTKFFKYPLEFMLLEKVIEKFYD